MRNFARLAFAAVGLDWEKHVEVDPRFVRPTEIHELVGDCRKATKAFGWRAEVQLPQLVEMMVRADVDRLGR